MVLCLGPRSRRNCAKFWNRISIFPKKYDPEYKLRLATGPAQKFIDELEELVVAPEDRERARTLELTDGEKEFLQLILLCYQRMVFSLFYIFLSSQKPSFLIMSRTCKAPRLP